MTNKARSIVFSSFYLTETCNEEDDGANKVVIPKTVSTDSYVYFRRNIDYVDRFNESKAYKYNFFPIVLCADSSPWIEANLFLLSKLESSISPNMATFQSIASDLADFRNFLDQENLDPFDFPNRKLLRPTYRYRNFNLLKAQAKEFSLNTAKRRVGVVISFYRWIISESIVEIKNTPWIEKSVHVYLNNKFGASILNKVRTTDLSIKALKSNNPYSDTIKDGGELRPLTPSEQVILFNVLGALGNIEMTLIHLISLFTGARIQTVLTLRTTMFQKETSPNMHEVRLKIGPGTGVDTKNDKLMTIFLPYQLYEKLRIYTLSNRSIQRKVKAKEIHLDYLFLTNRGTPYYDSKDEILNFNQDNKKRRANNGQGVRQFIANKVLPLMRRKEGLQNFNYKFHDIRATYGLNLTKTQIDLVQKGKCNLHQAREFVRARMGHSNSSTTDLYLQYKDSMQLISNAQMNYEKHLDFLMEQILE